MAPQSLADGQDDSDSGDESMIDKKALQSNLNYDSDEKAEDTEPVDMIDIQKTQKNVPKLRKPNKK